MARFQISSVGNGLPRHESVNLDLLTPPTSSARSILMGRIPGGLAGRFPARSKLSIKVSKAASGSPFFCLGFGGQDCVIRWG